MQLAWDFIDIIQRISPGNSDERVIGTPVLTGVTPHGQTGMSSKVQPGECMAVRFSGILASWMKRARERDKAAIHRDFTDATPVFGRRNENRDSPCVLRNSETLHVAGTLDCRFVGPFSC